MCSDALDLEPPTFGICNWGGPRAQRQVAAGRKSACCALWGLAGGKTQGMEVSQLEYDILTTS